MKGKKILQSTLIIFGVSLFSHHKNFKSNPKRKNNDQHEWNMDQQNSQKWDIPFNKCQPKIKCLI